MRPHRITTDPGPGGKPSIAGIEAISSSGEVITTVARPSVPPSSFNSPVVIARRPFVSRVHAPSWRGPRVSCTGPTIGHPGGRSPPRDAGPTAACGGRRGLWGSRGNHLAGGDVVTVVNPPSRMDDRANPATDGRGVVTRGVDMARHSDLYRLIEPVPDLRSEDGRGPVLVHGLEGFSDAGLAIQGVSEHLRESLDSQLIVEFDVDELVDYRSRRPHLKYSFDRFADYNEPTIQMHAVKASDGTSFLLLSGLEPDLKWDGFTESVIDLAGSFGVRMSIGLGAMPLGVPHTRPTNSSAHASDVDLIKGFSAWPGEFSVPGNVTSLLELRMAEHGIPSAGFTVHVPQYLSQTAYPAAVLHLVGSIAEIADLELPTAELEKAAEEFTAQVNAQIAQSPEILTAVELMEKQYDEFMETRLGSDSLNPGGKPLPSGDEIGAEFERFLAQQTGDGGQGDDPQRDG